MKLVTNNFRYSSAKHFVDSVSETSTSTYYVFAGRPQPFANDNSVPVLYDNNQDVVYDVYDQMIFGKRVTPTDVCLMIKRYDWTSNTVYARYDDQDEQLSEKQYYVVNSNNAVFKCLNNNGGSPSTIEPVVQDPTDDSYITSDGYQWKYMYSASSATVAKFATSEYFPYVEDTNVTANATGGAIEVIDVVTPGERRYTATATAYFQDVNVGGNTLFHKLSANSSATDDIYVGSVIYLSEGPGAGGQRKIADYSGETKLIRLDSAFDTSPTISTQYTIVPSVTVGGNGLGARARAVVNASTKTIQSVLVTNRGAGYDYAPIEVEGYVSSTTPAAPVLRAILPPSGGHGKDQAAELRARWVGVATTLSSATSNNKVFDVNDYRIVGIIKNPKHRQVVLTISSDYDAGDFSIGDVVTQSNTNATGTVADIDETLNKITLENVSGLFAIGSGAGVQQLIITNPGSGYFANAVVTISGNTGSGATANTVANTTTANGRITSINLTNAGTGYLTVPTVSIASPNATFNANTNVNPVTVITLDTLNHVSNTANTIYFASDTFANNAFVNGDVVVYTTGAGNTVITGLTNTEAYYVVNANNTHLQLANTLSGAAIDLTSTETAQTSFLTNKSRVEDFITISSNKFLVGDKVRYIVNTGSTAISGLANGSYYNIRFANSTAIKLSNTSGYPIILVKGATETGHNLIGETATATAVISTSLSNIITDQDNTVSVTATAIAGQESYFDQTLRMQVLNYANETYFEDDETVIQPGRTGLEAANGVFYSSNNTSNNQTAIIRLVNTRGTFNPSGDGSVYTIRGTDAPAGTQPEANVQNITLPDLTYGSGEVIYIESVPPITKNARQTETFKFIFEF